MRRLLSILALVAVGSLAYAGGSVEAKETSAALPAVRVLVPTGFPGIVMSSIADRKDRVPGGREIEYTVLKSPDLLASRLISGEADIAIVPTNLAATLHNRTGKFVLAASVVWGILYGVSAEPLESLESLKGREVWSLGRGLTPDITFRHILRASGLNPDTDLTIHYVQDATELAPAFITGKAALAIVPEPVLSQILKKKPGTRIFLDVQKEWQRLTASSRSYPQASLIVSRDFLRDNAEWCKGFFLALEAGMARLKTDPVAAGDQAYAFLGEPAAGIITDSIPRANIQWVTAAQARPDLEQYFQVLLTADPKTIGGAMPDNSFYLDGK